MKWLTVGDLREMIANVPDDMEIVVDPEEDPVAYISEIKVLSGRRELRIYTKEAPIFDKDLHFVLL